MEHGLPSDFLERLARATTALEGSIDARGLARSRRIVAMIDASLSHALKDQPATLAAWRQAKRVTLKGTTVRLELDAVSEPAGAGSPVETPSTKAA